MVHKSKQEITAIIVSVLLAFVMWIYAMTDKNPLETRTVENIPVQLTNTETLEQFGYALTPDQSFTINLEIRCKALDVGTAIDTANYNIVADLNNIATFKKGENNIPVEITSKPSGIQVDNPTGAPYYIKVKLETLETKSVGVNINPIGNVKEGFGYLDPITKPTQVTVSGPESVVNSVNSVNGQIDITGKSSDVNASIAIKPVDRDGNEVKYVSIEKPVVDVSIPVKPAKEVGVIVDTVGNIGSNKVLKKINLSTEKVKIIGDKKYLDNVKEVRTVPYDISKIKTTYTDTLTLNLPEGIEVFHNMNTVSAEFVVENVIEDTVRIPINIVNQKQGYNYSTSVSDVNITLRGAESTINSLDTGTISAVVDVNNIDVGQHNLELKINVPDGISIAKMVPDKVSVTITKPETDTTSP